MDGRRFDEMSRAMATGQSRRTLLKGFGGGALAGLATLIGGSAAGARGSKVGICHKTWAWSTDWRYITVDADNERRIQSHLEHGDTVDPDFSSDPNHCGECGNACSAPANASAWCDGGSCGWSCDPGFHPDGDACLPDCVDDGTACGDRLCGTAINNCGETVVCGTGVCVPGSCCDGNECVIGSVQGEDGMCPDICLGCGGSGANYPVCEETGCCEQNVLGSHCSDSLPCCQGNLEGSRLCQDGLCCLANGYPASSRVYCCSGWLDANGICAEA